jgi:hypothetical protein
MLIEDGLVLLSASDLVGHLNCRYMTGLDLSVARGELAKPKVWDDPALEALSERGALHERNYLDYLEANGVPIVSIDGKAIDATARRANA